MTPHARRRREGGSTVAEGLAALALIAVGLTASYSILIRGGAVSERIEAAEARAAAAERIMERTVAMRFDDVVPCALSLDSEEHEGRIGWTAEVRVEDRGPLLKSVEVIVRGAGGESGFTTMIARRGTWDETLLASGSR